jgi:cytochrome c heme-lyase
VVVHFNIVFVCKNLKESCSLLPPFYIRGFALFWENNNVEILHCFEGLNMEERCPVDHGKKEERCPVEHGRKEDSCPVDHGKRGPSTPQYNAPANDMAFDHSVAEGQKIELSKTRTISTIPKGDFTPSHQPSSGQEKWVYPSEQQYFNAMRRKGYDTKEKDVPSVLYIHNAVNEQGWTKIKEWEAYNGNINPKLKRFMGRPNDMSPRARILNFLG